MPVSRRLAALGLLTTALLTGCASQNSFETELLQSVAKGQAEITLPAHAPIEDWSEVLVVCPYADLSKIESPFNEDLPDPRSPEPIPEGSQLLIFTNGSDTGSLQMDRIKVDLCVSNPTEPMSANQPWTVLHSEDDGRYLLSPAPEKSGS